MTSKLDQLRRRYAVALAELHDYVYDNCPGPHEPVQHRDRRPPWCAVCRYTDMGIKVETPATMVRP